MCNVIITGGALDPFLPIMLSEFADEQLPYNLQTDCCANEVSSHCSFFIAGCGEKTGEGKVQCME